MTGQSQPSILFIHLPNGQESARLETMPFAYNVVRLTAATGDKLSVCLWEKLQEPYLWLNASPNVDLYFFRFGVWLRLSRFFPYLKYLWAVHLALVTRRRFDYIFALGPKALVMSSLLKKFMGGKLIYLNDEFPSCWWWDRHLKQVELPAAKYIDIVVAPDPCRTATVLHELGLPASHPVFALPNAPLSQICSPNMAWRRRLGIPDGKKIVLHAGSVCDWAQIPEALFAASEMPSDTVLVIHSRGGDDLLQYRKSLTHLDLEGRVFWSTDAVSEEQLSSMIASAECTLGLYRNVAPNVEQMGMASGKIMRSIVLGVPVVATRFASLQFIEQYGVGCLVTHPNEIPAAVARIEANSGTMRRNCLEFSRIHLNMRTHMDGLWKMLGRTLDQESGG